MSHLDDLPPEIAEAVVRTVDQAPPLSASQLANLRVLLAPALAAVREKSAAKRGRRNSKAA